MKNYVSQIVEGVKFPTLTSIAKAYGLKSHIVNKRHQRGNRGDNLIPLENRKNYIPQIEPDNLKFVVGKLKFKNPTDACRKLNISYNKYRARIRQGWTIEQALELVPKIDGRTLKAKKNSSPKSIKRKKMKKPLVAFGKEYKSYEEVARIFGIEYSVLYQRVNSCGKTLEEALLMDGKGKKVKFGNKEFESGAECARAIGIEPNTFYYLRKHFSLNQIIGNENRMTSISLVYKGKFYPSKVALAEEYGLTKNQFYYRTYVCKLSLEDALSIPSNSSVVESVFGNHAKLYIAEVIGREADLSDEKRLYKIGVTQHQLSKRYKELPFECKTVHFKEGNLKELRELEKMIHSKIKNKQYTDFTARDFDGFTEMFQLTGSELNEIKFLIKFDKLNQKEEDVLRTSNNG